MASPPGPGPDPPEEEQQPAPRGRVTRRTLLTAAGGAAGGLALAGAGYAAGRSEAEDGGPAEIAGAVAFHGRHQAGIATPAQDRLHFAAFDLTTRSRHELRELLREWSQAAARMMAGETAGPNNATPLAPPDDTGEALGLPPSALTVTFGLGTSLFDGRFGLAGKRPAALADLPPFAGDELQPERSGGDLCVQACANDPQVAFHAVRNLARIGRGAAVMRWSQLGFGRTSSTSVSQATPRNLMGSKDGTNNIRAEDIDAMTRHVWVSDRDEPAWMRGGSYVVTRRIRMLIEVWDRASLDDQERTIGRLKLSGAPLHATHEFDPVDLDRRGRDGKLVIPPDAHIRLASPKTNDGARMLRRGYSFTDGMDTRSGQLDAGLFFIAYQRDPREAFVPVQRRLGKLDALNEYIVHTGSGLFAVPPGFSPGGYAGETLV